MNILYHLTVLPPQMPECEALSQEITALRAEFGGNLVYLNPNQRFPLYIPRLLFGFHKLSQLRHQEAGIDLHHLYNPDAFAFPILRRLRRPVLYTITSGVGAKPPNLDYFSSLAAITVPDERSLKQLKGWGLNNVHLVRAGIDTRRFSFTDTPLHSEIRLMVGSAPWTKAQFATKGIDALLKAASLNRRLHLVFLWRGVLVDEMRSRVRQLDLENQVEVINKQVDVNRILAQVHASITLAEKPGIIKSYPHSLLDSLAAGKPVLVSRAIPMADYVEERACGQVIETVTATDILAALDTLKQRYQLLQSKARQVDRQDFSQQAMIVAYCNIYNLVLNET
jgi:glycosyltransferase involved in cell wall biosynthesis